MPRNMRVISLDAPEGILAMLGTIALYELTKDLPQKKTHLCRCVF
ncbi:DUF3937 family protein [Bacillus thuringiensis]